MARDLDLGDVVHGYPEAEKELAALITAANHARSFIKRYHWRFCPPRDKWPDGSWDLDEAKDVYQKLNAVLPQAPAGATKKGVKCGP